jgi:hypothetical protein
MVRRSDVIHRLHAALIAFWHPNTVFRAGELHKALAEIYEWTAYKETPWALRVRQLLIGREEG